MSDSKYIVGSQDRRRINIHQSYELHDWAKALGVTQDELKQAVAQVGDNADRVRDYLHKHGRQAATRH